MADSTQAQPTDERLLEVIGGPDGGARQEAVGRLLGRYRARVYAWCYKHLRDEEAALDMAQDVMIAAYRSLGEFRGQSRFSTWLFAITRNHCLSSRRRPGLLLDPGIEPEELAAHGRDPEQELIETLDLEEVLDLIHTQLLPLEQDALSLRAFEGLSVEAITEILGIDRDTGARTVLQTARRKLRAALARRRRHRIGGRA